MSPDSLGTALRDLVDDLEDALAAPVADDLWAGGRRRRRTARLVPVLAAACVAGLVALVVWPSGAPRASVPAVRLDDGNARLTAYPADIAKPPFTRQTATPGVTAAVVNGDWTDSDLYSVSPAGSVVRLDLPDVGSAAAAPASISPDGRWLARGWMLADLVDGSVAPAPDVRARLVEQRLPVDEPAWWSPDSTRALVAGADQEDPMSPGVVVGIDGSVTPVPTLDVGITPIVAGWLDGDTVLSLLDLGGGASLLEVRTWVVGTPAWTRPGTVVSWPDQLEESILRATLSPSGDRLLLTASRSQGSRMGDVQGTAAMMFDPRTGAGLGMPDDDGPLRYRESASLWPGWGCRPAWKDDEPVITDILVSTPRRPDRSIVGVSSRFSSTCVAFAGNELSGDPIPNRGAVWKERLWVYGMPTAVLLLGGMLLWRLDRRRNWRERPRWLPAIWVQRY